MKRALITGGTSVLGEAMCRELAGQGTARYRPRLRPDRGGRAACAANPPRRRLGGAISCDLTDVTSTATAPDSVLGEGVPQIIVHNAGTHADAPLAGMSERQWRDVLDVPLTGFYAITRPLLLPMIATRWGRIVAISSVSGVIGNRGQVN